MCQEFNVKKLGFDLGILKAYDMIKTYENIKYEVLIATH